MKQIYFFIISFEALTIAVQSINSGITFAQEKNETAELDDSALITIPQIDESMETTNNLSQRVNDTS